MKIPTLTKFIILSMVAVAFYTAVLLWLKVSYDFWIDTEFSKLWYAYWGSEIFICAGLRAGNIVAGRNNTITVQAQKPNSSGEDAVG